MDVATAVHEHIAEVIIPSLPDGVVAAIPAHAGSRCR